MTELVPEDWVSKGQLMSMLGAGNAGKAFEIVMNVLVEQTRQFAEESLEACIFQTLDDRQIEAKYGRKLSSSRETVYFNPDCLGAIRNEIERVEPLIPRGGYSSEQLHYKLADLNSKRLTVQLNSRSAMQAIADSASPIEASCVIRNEPKPQKALPLVPEDWLSNVDITFALDCGHASKAYRTIIHALIAQTKEAGQEGEQCVFKMPDGRQIVALYGTKPNSIISTVYFNPESLDIIRSEIERVKELMPLGGSSTHRFELCYEVVSPHKPADLPSTSTVVFTDKDCVDLMIGNPGSSYPRDPLAEYMLNQGARSHANVKSIYERSKQKDSKTPQR